jgi:hypothetical protein
MMASHGMMAAVVPRMMPGVMPVGMSEGRGEAKAMGMAAAASGMSFGPAGDQGLDGLYSGLQLFLVTLELHSESFLRLCDLERAVTAAGLLGGHFLSPPFHREVSSKPTACGGRPRQSDPIDVCKYLHTSILNSKKTQLAYLPCCDLQWQKWAMIISQQCIILSRCTL